MPNIIDLTLVSRMALVIDEGSEWQCEGGVMMADVNFYSILIWAS